jgi:hypothetical protein
LDIGYSFIAQCLKTRGTQSLTLIMSHDVIILDSFLLYQASRT